MTNSNSISNSVDEMLQLGKKKSSKVKSVDSIKAQLISRMNCTVYTRSNNETSG